MLKPDSPLGRLLNQPMRPGRVEWIGLRPSRAAPLDIRDSAVLVAGRGVEGDRYRTTRNGPRQVSLAAAEDLAAIASFMGLETLGPEALRRNILVSGINLQALKDRRFRLGGALLEGSGDCHPCSLMEILIGPGGYNAARGRGGIVARVLEGGLVSLGDTVEALPRPESP